MTRKATVIIDDETGDRLTREEVADMLGITTATLAVRISTRRIRHGDEDGTVYLSALRTTRAQARTFEVLDDRQDRIDIRHPPRLIEVTVSTLMELADRSRQKVLKAINEYQRDLGGGMMNLGQLLERCAQSHSHGRRALTNAERKALALGRARHKATLRHMRVNREGPALAAIEKILFGPVVDAEPVAALPKPVEAPSEPEPSPPPTRRYRYEY